MTALVVSQTEVRKLLPMDACVDLMAEALATLSGGDAINPLRTGIRLPNNLGILGMMLGYMERPKALGLKVVAVFPGNHGTEFVTSTRWDRACTSPGNSTRRRWFGRGCSWTGGNPLSTKQEIFCSPKRKEPSTTFSSGTWSDVNLGVERISKIGMPLLFVLLLVLIARSLTLPGGGAGLKFYLFPDFSRIDLGVVTAALGQVFFSLSLGGTFLVTYASYLPASTNLKTTAVSIGLGETLAAVLAGFVIVQPLWSLDSDSKADRRSRLSPCRASSDR